MENRDSSSHLIYQLDALNKELDKILYSFEGHFEFGDVFKENFTEDLLRNQEISYRILREKRYELSALRDCIELETKDPGDLGPVWDKFQAIHFECLSLFREYLGFLQGSILRKTGLINEKIYFLTEKLLEELSMVMLRPRSPLIVIGAKDSANEYNTISVHFPCENFWNIPIIAHELGHLVEFELRKLKYYDSLKGFMDRELQNDSNSQKFFVEYFCDIFGVYVMGPAFAFSYILLNACPFGAYEDQTDHPSDAKRVYLILEGLRIMNEKERGDDTDIGKYDVVIANIEHVWAKSLSRASKKPKILDLDQLTKLDLWIRLVFKLFDIYLPPGVRYQQRSLLHGWACARALADDWIQQFEESRTLSKRAEISVFEVRDVLNAAWFVFFIEPSLRTKLPEVAIHTCYEIDGAKLARNKRKKSRPVKRQSSEES